MADDYRVGFAPLDEEVSTELPVVGAMPPWLCGSLIRNGPARYAVGDPPQRYRHWFDGLAMLHRFVLDDGKVQYANRFLRSRTYQHAVEHGEIGYGEFGTSPDRSLLDTVASAVSGPAYSDNANVNVLQVGGRHVAVTETPTPIAFDPETLETVGPLDWEDDLPGYVTTGHPHHDPQRAALINYTVEFGRSSSYHLYEFPDGSLQRRLIGSVPVDEPAYMHSFVMTEHYVVLVEYPYLANPLSLRVSPRPFIESYRWRPERGNRFTVVDRRTGEVVRRATTDAFFCFHQVNGYEDEDGSSLVIDLPSMPGERAVEQFYLDQLRGEGPRTPAGELRRYCVPLDDRPPTYRLLTTAPLEFPRIAYERRSGRPYRSVWGAGSAQSLTTGFFDRLVHLDVETGRTTTWASPHCWPGEPVPVAAPGAQAEDDGVLLSVVLDAAARRSFLLVLDAASMQELARADLPHHAPLGFHGQFFPTARG